MAAAPLLLVIDEGTTSTRVLLYDARDGAVLASEQSELTQYYPADGMVEHDAAEIWRETLACAKAVIDKAGGAEKIAAIGITNQRETVVAWDAQTGEPLHRAIVWQDRRTADRCAELKAEGHEALVQAKTGLLLDPYFSATKMRWLLDQPAVKTAGDKARLGTIDSWLAFKLSGGSAHVSDASNASRTSLLALDGSDWNDTLLALFDIPRSALPTIVPTHGEQTKSAPGLFGRAIPITAMIGDQQSATLGQGCSAPGRAKLTLGTGAFALAHAGNAPPANSGRLLGTILSDDGAARDFAIEGSIFVAGSLMQWLRDQLGILMTAAESEALARSVPDSGGVAMLPALSGLGTPHWQPDVRAMVTGMSFATTRAHLARAALESISHQVKDLADAFAAAGAAWNELRIDGGMSANDWLAQDLADLLRIPVIRPDDVETTARGAAVAAAVGAGLHPDLASAAAAMQRGETRFEPKMSEADREERLARWQKLISLALA